MNRTISWLLTVGLTMTSAVPARPAPDDAAAALPPLEPYVTLLQVHPAEGLSRQGAEAIPMPVIVRQGESANSGGQQIQVPNVVTPERAAEEANGNVDGKAGTGFFIGDDGTLLTAAHVARGCSRMQIISKYVARAWVSPVAMDEDHDIAVLKAPNLRPPAVMRLASAAPSTGRLFILGFPATASLTVPAETWAVTENEKFPPNIGPLANPRDLLWMSAPDVTHGYSGGPIFDPRQGAVVGIVKGEVNGGYLRLVRDMPTTGVAIGPGIAEIGALVRREVPYSTVSLVSSPGQSGQETLRRATVHVLCWQ